MLIRILNQENPEHEGELLRDYYALYAAGNAFKARIGRFLRRNPQEPADTYQMRQEEAAYRSYLGTVVDYFAALLFSVPVIYKPQLRDVDVEPPEWVKEFADDVNGRGTDLGDFLRSTMIEASVKRRVFWLIDFPESYGSAASKFDAERDGSLDVKLRIVPRETVLDWAHDKRGRLLWAIIYGCESIRDTPDDERKSVLHTWTVVDRRKIQKFQVITGKSEHPNPELNVDPTWEIEHQFGACPLVELDVGDGLWVANRLASPQTEHFRLSAANNWSMRRTAYAMPVLHLENPDDFGAQRMGAGYFLKLGVNEKADWIAPPSQHFDAVTEEVRNQKDEIFLIVTQMSLGIDNNAAAIGRSAESKMADAEAIQVVLRAYANKVRDALKTGLTLLSRARGEQHEWVVEGLDRFETLAPDVLIELLKTALDIGVPSKTFKVEAKFRAATALLPGLDSTTKDTIREEIKRGVDEEERNDTDLLNIARGVGGAPQGRPAPDDRGGGHDLATAPTGRQEGRRNQGRAQA